MMSTFKGLKIASKYNNTTAETKFPVLNQENTIIKIKVINTYKVYENSARNIFYVG